MSTKIIITNILTIVFVVSCVSIPRNKNVLHIQNIAKIKTISTPHQPIIPTTSPPNQHSPLWVRSEQGPPSTPWAGVGEVAPKIGFNCAVHSHGGCPNTRQRFISLPGKKFSTRTHSQFTHSQFTVHTFTVHSSHLSTLRSVLSFFLYTTFCTLCSQGFGVAPYFIGNVAISDPG